MFLNVRYGSLVAIQIRLRKSCLGMLGGLSLLLYKFSIQISMVSSRWIFVNKEPTSRLAKCKLVHCWQISFAKWNGPKTVYLLTVDGVKKFSKNFANLKISVPIAERIEQKGGSPLRVSFWILHK